MGSILIVMMDQMKLQVPAVTFEITFTLKICTRKIHYYIQLAQFHLNLKENFLRGNPVQFYSRYFLRILLIIYLLVR